MKGWGRLVPNSLHEIGHKWGRAVPTPPRERPHELAVDRAHPKQLGLDGVFPHRDSFFSMSQSLPRVTILIAAPPGQAEILAVNAGKIIDYPHDRFEIIVARGRQPSVQRNHGIRAAQGDLIYFLDDDSQPRPGDLRQAVRHFEDSKVKMVGGPNLCPPDAPSLEQVFATVLSSWIAFGPSRARYIPVGQPRPTSEKELILCNLIARRETLLSAGCFNEALYPNEENALMDDIQKQGGKLMYDPELIVHRRPRRSLQAFSRMLRNYGRGRAEQFRVNPTFGSMLNFAPPFFCLYLANLLALATLFLVLPLPSLLLTIAAFPLGAYAVVLLLQTLALVLSRGVGNATMAFPLLAWSHLMYGFGFWRGLFTHLKQDRAKAPVEVKLETVPF